MNTFGTEFWKFPRKGVVFSKKANFWPKSSTTAHDSWWLCRCHDLPLIASLVRASKRWLPRRRSPHPRQTERSLDTRHAKWYMTRRTTRRTVSSKRQSISVSKMFQKYECRGLTPPPASEKFVSSQIEGDGWLSTVTVPVTNTHSKIAKWMQWDKQCQCQYKYESNVYSISITQM